MTKEERLLYYKEGYKKGWADAMRRIKVEADGLMFNDKACYVATNLTDIQITRPQKIKIPREGKKKNIIQIAALLDIWRKDKSKLPKQIIFRGHMFDFKENTGLEDYVARETDSYGDYIYFWDFIEGPSILNETVEVV